LKPFFDNILVILKSEIIVSSAVFDIYIYGREVFI